MVAFALCPVGKHPCLLCPSGLDGGRGLQGAEGGRVRESGARESAGESKRNRQWGEMGTGEAIGTAGGNNWSRHGPGMLLGGPSVVAKRWGCRKHMGSRPWNREGSKPAAPPLGAVWSWQLLIGFSFGVLVSGLPNGFCPLWSIITPQNSFGTDLELVRPPPNVWIVSNPNFYFVCPMGIPIVYSLCTGL